MKTPEEIKEGLRICTQEDHCDGCPYLSVDFCETYLQKDSFAYINALEETISLMKIQMRGDCGCCKHGRDGDMKRCNECLLSREYHPLWEYEGLPEVEVYESEMPVLR